MDKEIKRMGIISAIEKNTLKQWIVKMVKGRE
jgi:hypothetical protein